MPASLIYHSKVHLMHRDEDGVGIAELKVWEIPKTKDYPSDIKYSMFLVWKESGELIFGFDNHKSKGPHVHHGKQEKSYGFKDVDTLIKDFWKHVYEEGFLI